MHMQATGFLLDIPRVEVLINSSRLSSKLKLDVKLLPIKALLESTGMHQGINLDASGLVPPGLLMSRQFGLPSYPMCLLLSHIYVCVTDSDLIPIPRLPPIMSVFVVSHTLGV